MYVNESQRVPPFIFRHYATFSKFCFKKKFFKKIFKFYFVPSRETVIFQSYRAWKAHFGCLESVFKAFHEYVLSIFRKLCASWALDIAPNLDVPVLFQFEAEHWLGSYLVQFSLDQFWLSKNNSGCETLFSLHILLEIQCSMVSFYQIQICVFFLIPNEVFCFTNDFLEGEELFFQGTRRQGTSEVQGFLWFQSFQSFPKEATRYFFRTVFFYHFFLLLQPCIHVIEVCSFSGYSLEIAPHRRKNPVKSTTSHFNLAWLCLQHIEVNFLLFFHSAETFKIHSHDFEKPAFGFHRTNESFHSRNHDVTHGFCNC